ncbi:hypothetical protein C448_05643 [Halococcus morrhuae DSM 1307]|uniref:Uncharacterized protein n=1 Tax=Halococcus morrhuae DSM 1307 TaxID=931277 RepID=M0MQU7_HALMO|nr:hypothetical protein C448_05643 [Halococcus morrhuae DSM 1307]
MKFVEFLKELIAEMLAGLMLALFGGVQLRRTPQEVTQFERRVIDEFVDSVRRKIRRVAQHDAEFLAELSLECIQQPNRETTRKIILARRVERLALIGDPAQQFQIRPHARCRQFRALSFSKSRIDEIR